MRMKKYVATLISLYCFTIPYVTFAAPTLTPSPSPTQIPQQNTGLNPNLVQVLTPEDMNKALAANNQNFTVWAMLIGLAILGTIMFVLMYTLITKANKANEKSNAAIGEMIRQQFETAIQQQEQFSRLVENNTKALNALTKEMLQIQNARTLERNEILVMSQNVSEMKSYFNDCRSAMSVQLNNLNNSITNMYSYCTSFNKAKFLEDKEKKNLCEDK